METSQNKTNSQPAIPNEKSQGLSLHAKMFFGLLFGAIAGLTANLLFADNPSLEWAVKNLTEPVGQIFLRLMTMVVVPLVFCSLTLGVASLGDLRKLGRIGVKTLCLFLLTTGIASGIGLFMVNVAKPGVGLSEDVKTRLMHIYSEDAKKSIVQATENQQMSGFSLRWLLPLIPKNPLASAVQADMLPVIFFSMVLGMALTRMPLSRSQGFVAFLSGLGEAMVVIIDFALALAPYGVGALIFSVTARFGFSLLGKLAWFVFTVLFGLLFHQFVVLSAFIYFGAGVNLIAFYQAIKVVMLTAFSTSSSNATLPTTMRQGEEELGIPKDICGFVLPLGATVNMNGSAPSERIFVLLLAPVFGF